MPPFSSSTASLSPLPRSRVVVVGDASDAVGRAIALLVAERGHAVLAIGRDAQALADLPRETAAGGILETCVADDFAVAAARAIRLFGRLDALVVAPPAAPRGPFNDLSARALVLPLELAASLIATSIPHLGGGRLVLVAPLPTPPPDPPASALAAALAALAGPLAVELAPQATAVVSVVIERGRTRRVATATGLAEVVASALVAPRPKARYALKTRPAR